MHKLNYLLLGILFFSVIVSAQDYYNVIRIRPGYGSYNMDDLGRIQNFLVDTYSQQNIPVATVDNFPSYWNFQLQFSHRVFESFNLTGFFGFASTGGRIHYRDFSGEIKSDQSVKANSYGIGFEYYFNPTESFKFFTAAQFSLIYSSLELSDFIQIYSATDNLSTKFEAFGIGFEPSAGIEYEISPFLFRLELGLLLNAEGAFYFVDRNDIKLKLSNKEISPDWMGYRIGFSMGIGF